MHGSFLCVLDCIPLVPSLNCWLLSNGDFIQLYIIYFIIYCHNDYPLEKKSICVKLKNPNEMSFFITNSDTSKQ